MSMKNIAGQAVRGKNFFKRPSLARQFHSIIDSGSSILITAPRRVGKTSLMLHVCDNPIPHCFFIYLITESVGNENEFFKRLLDEIFETEFLSSLQKASKKTYLALKDRLARIDEVGKNVKFGKESRLDYREEFIDIIKSIDLGEQRLIIMIDEFSQTVENIIADEGVRKAVHFLQVNRELRQDPVLNQKLQFVYSGSIGLENIVNRLDAINLVNDLDSLRVPPLSAKESHLLMQQLTEEWPTALSKGNRDYILDKIQWYIPFYIQLAVKEISNLLIKSEEGTGTVKKRVSKKLIDNAFTLMLKRRNAFEHWQTRLRKAFKNEEYQFAQQVLDMISYDECIDGGEIYNMAMKIDVTGAYKDIVNSLVHDGYINNSDEPSLYRFNSPLLRMWWRENAARYNDLTDL